MISGIGIDAVEIERIREGLKRHGERFVAHIAHPADRSNAPQREPRRSEYWAARFAAKEAFSKAMGTGIGSVVQWRSVGVRKAAKGRPELVFSPALKKSLTKKGVSNAQLAITHTKGLAIAVVILE